MTVTCVICSKAVYPVEMIKIDDLAMHKTCLRCAHCNTTLSLGKYAALNGKYYCKPHFKQLFALKGNYHEGFGEEKPGAHHGENHGGVSNPAPLGKSGSAANLKGSLANLKKMGSNSSLKRSRTELDEGEPIHAVGHVQERIGRSIEDLSNKVAALNRGDSKSNLRGSRSNLGPVTRSRSALNGSGSISNLHDGPNKRAVFGAPAAAGGNKNSCTHCNKTAYPMEQIVVEGVIFHKTCFRCAHCTNILSLGKYAALDGKYYCKPHFKQLFALKGNYNEGFGTRPHKEKWLEKERTDGNDTGAPSEQTGERSAAAM